MKNSVIILGSGGHAKVLIDVLELQSIPIIGLTEKDVKKCGSKIQGYLILGTDEEVASYPKDNVSLVNGMGSVRLDSQRIHLFERFKREHYEFKNVIHPSAIIAKDVLLGEGVQVMAGAIIQAGTKIGDNVIINSGAIVDHDCVIGNHSHISPGAILSGAVHIGSSSHIGTGAKIIQGIEIGDNCLIGAGSVVIKNIESDSKVAGVPAKKI